MERFIGTKKIHVLAQENNQWPPTGEFHRCLHWVVRDVTFLESEAG